MGKIRNTEIFKKEIRELYGNDILVLGIFVSMKTKVKMECNIHKIYFEKEPDKILNRNQHCPACGRERIANSRRKPTVNFEKDFYQCRSSSEYLLLSEYKGDREEIKILHYICKEEFTTTPSSVWASKGCPICNNRRKSTEDFKKEVFEIEDNEYEVLGDYDNCYTHIEIKHKKCGHKWELIPNSFLQGSRCPRCNESKGEKLISSYLKKKNIHHNIHIKFDDCRNKALLSYDAGINTEDSSLLIEFDGQQHFYPVERFGGNKKFINQLENDKIKNQYCIKKKIPLIRIPYWEFSDIESILESTLIHFGLIESNPDYDNSKVLEYLVDKNWNHDEYIAKCPKNIKEKDKSDSIAI